MNISSMIFRDTSRGLFQCPPVSATPFFVCFRWLGPEDGFRCGGERWNQRPNDVAAEKDGTGGRMSLRRRKMEPESESRCGGERWNQRANVVAAGQAATPAAFYLGLCRLRGNLSPPASATVILKASRSSVQQRWRCRRNHSSLPQRR